MTTDGSSCFCLQFTTDTGRRENDATGRENVECFTSRYDAARQCSFITSFGTGREPCGWHNVIAVVVVRFPAFATRRRDGRSGC